jgi:hypothetical protein
VLLPLAEIVATVAPAHLASLMALAKQLEAERQRDRAMSWEAAILAAALELAKEKMVRNGLLLIADLADRVNDDRSEREQLSNKRISDVLRSLGLTTRAAHANKAALVWEAAKIEELKAHYAPPEPTEPPVE